MRFDFIAAWDLKKYGCVAHCKKTRGVPFVNNYALPLTGGEISNQ
jgi:hypothetical protein